MEQAGSEEVDEPPVVNGGVPKAKVVTSQVESVVAISDVDIVVTSSNETMNGTSKDRRDSSDSNGTDTRATSELEGHKTRRLLMNRKSSSDGAAKALETPREERIRRCSECSERAAALRVKINEMYDEFHKEMSAKSQLARGDCQVCPKNIISEECSCDPTNGGNVPNAKRTDIRVRSVSMAEVKEIAFSRLHDELHKAQLELKLKDEEVFRLSKIRDEVGNELEELTASLFEEANNMVQDALMKQANAERQLQEANMKVEGLQAEVQALKTLVITSTPSMPNKHLHPQIDSKVNGVKALFRGHRRSPSNYELASMTESPPSSPVKEVPPSSFLPQLYEVDPVYHQEFVTWRQNPNMDKSDPFLIRIYQEDILPCLRFSSNKLVESVLEAIENNCLVIEEVSGKNPFPKRCALLEAPRLCKYKMKLGDNEEWHYISQLGRNRITAVCEFYCYLRYIQQGLVKNGIHEVYWEVIRRRQAISMARLGILTQ